MTTRRSDDETIRRTLATTSIKALDEKQFYVPATSTSFTAILEYFSTPIQLDLSQVQLKTISRKDYCQQVQGDSKYCKELNVAHRVTDTNYLHLLLFDLPPECIKKGSTGQICDWSKLGIGNSNSIDSAYCCTTEKHQQGECEHVSQLILTNKFVGQVRFLEVPSKINQKFPLGIQGVFDVPKAGDYAFVMANCNENGWDILSLPQTVKLSSPSYLQGMVAYYASLTFYHFALLLTYGFTIMVLKKDSALPIQKWLGATMLVASLDVLFKCINYSSWDAEQKSWFNIFTVSVTFGVLKRGMSMCVGVMVANGWGVVRTSLGGNAWGIGIFGFLYTGILLFHDIPNALAETNLKGEIMARGGDFTQQAGILYFVTFAMDILCLVWMLVSVRYTILHLKSASRYDQVSHHRILGCLLTISMLAIAPAWIIQFVDKFESSPILTEEQWNYMNAGVQGIYTIILTGVATLWIPNQTHQSVQVETCMEMKELYSENLRGESHEEEEEEENDDGPSGPYSDDDGGNDPDHPNGLLVSNGELS